MSTSQRFYFTTSVAALLLYVSGASPASSSDPQWIWASQDREVDQSPVFSRRFELASVPAEVQLQLLADFTSASVSINGRNVAEVDSYASAVKAEISQFLRVGSNSISIHCESVDGPSAIAVVVLGGEAGESSTVPGVVSKRRTWSRNEAQSRGAALLVSDATWRVVALTAVSDLEEFNVEAAPSADKESDWSPAVCFGPVAETLWANEKLAITAVDDYTQWKQAIGQDRGTDPSTFLVPQGFEIELLRSAAEDEDSWVAMAFDPKGRLTVAMEQKGLLRFTLPADDREEIQVERIDNRLLECRGLLYAYDSLYANANNSKGLYRLRDTDGDDRFDQLTLLHKSAGGVGHGRNDLTLGPDGRIYSIHGDAVDLPRDMLDRTSPFREHRRGVKTNEGHVIRIDKNGNSEELVLAGLRNPFGIDFHRDGEMFTYDADAEHDMGSPWYRPTRVNHLLPGADFGWRGVTKQWPPYYPDRADAAPPTLDIGKGSPTAVKFGYQSSFPAPYRNALFALDWTYGRVLAVHTVARGASYVASAETFLRGKPLNVTDLDFGPDGAMYLITGGRKTQSALYRVKYHGAQVDESPPTSQQQARLDHARRARSLRKRLEAYHGRVDAAAIDVAWPCLDHADPAIRHAARIAIEHQPLATWQDRALREKRTTASLTALMMLAGGANSKLLDEIISRLNGIPLKELTASQKWTALRTYEICLDRGEFVDGKKKRATAASLDSIYPDKSPRVNQLASKLLVRVDATGIVPKTLTLLEQAELQAEKLHYLFVLRNVKGGWSVDQRQKYLLHLREMRAFRGGEGMPGFISRISEEAISGLQGDELVDAKRFLAAGDVIGDVSVDSKREVVRHWTTAEILAAMKGSSDTADLVQGRKLFAVAQCASCHRVGSNGNVSGPDLTSVASRFSMRDLLESIITPSKVVAEKYQSDVIVTRDGQVITGSIVQAGDYRSPTLRVSIAPLDPTKTVEISKNDIESHTQSPISRMPEGLLDTLEMDEIFALLTYIRSGVHE